MIQIEFDRISAEKRPDGRTIYPLLRYINEEPNICIKFFRVQIPSGIHEEEHFHRYSDEIFIFLNSGIIVVNEQKRIIKKGDLVVIKKNDKHKIIAETMIDLIGIKIPDNEDKVIVKNENSKK